MLEYLNERLAAARPPTSLPDLSGHRQHALDDIIDHFSVSLSFDAHGGISLLSDAESGRSAASASHPLAAFSYESFTEADFDNFMESYSYCPFPDCPQWAILDFGKVDLDVRASPVHHHVRPTIEGVYSKEADDGRLHVVAVSTMPSDLVVNYGAPSLVYTEVWLPTTPGADIDIHVSMFNKTTTRLPETLWVTFNPVDSGERLDEWSMRKLSTELSPLNVVNNGSKHMHNVEAVVAPRIAITPLDSGLACFGKPNVFPVPLDETPDVGQGVSFSVYNNIWGTNYVMWYPYHDDEPHLRSRFVVSLRD